MTEAAYRRGDYLEKRRTLMADLGLYIYFSNVTQDESFDE
jgi:hypothetical protein